MNKATISDVMHGKTLIERITIKKIFSDISRLLTAGQPHVRSELAAKFEAAREAAYKADKRRAWFKFPTK